LLLPLYDLSVTAYSKTFSSSCTFNKLWLLFILILRAFELVFLVLEVAAVDIPIFFSDSFGGGLGFLKWNDFLEGRLWIVDIKLALVVVKPAVD
jgi:hypothetical protein